MLFLISTKGGFTVIDALKIKIGGVVKSIENSWKVEPETWRSIFSGKKGSRKKLEWRILQVGASMQQLFVELPGDPPFSSFPSKNILRHGIQNEKNI